jgi:4'-phosphopantetheinyl transferase
VITLLGASADEVPEGGAWLVPAERAVLARLNQPRRRDDWRLGRWAAKNAVATVLDLSAPEVEIRAAEDGAPEALRDGRLLPVAISISHRAGVAVSAVAAPPRPVGCDLELVEPRAGAFAGEWFGPRERALLAAAPPGDHDLLVTVLWSAKESALKVGRCGLRGDPRSVEVSLGAGDTAGWCPFAVRDRERGVDLGGWWRRLDGLVLTVAAPHLPWPPALVRGG